MQEEQKFHYYECTKTHNLTAECTCSVVKRYNQLQEVEKLRKLRQSIFWGHVFDLSLLPEVDCLIDRLQRYETEVKIK